MKYFFTILGLVITIMLPPMHAAASQELIVSAAASLTDAFSDIEPAFEKLHPGVDVIFNFASSGALYRQIEQGAPVDIFASANPKWMEKALEEEFVSKSDAVVFARNSLVLAVPSENPSMIKGVADLTGTNVGKIGIGTPETVPAGQYAKQALTAMGIFDGLERKMIYGESVRQVLDYLYRGEIDCGFVYGTDAVKAGVSVLIIEEIPLEKPVSYPIGVAKESHNRELARAFVDFVQSDAGIAFLEARGFTRP